jgi:hypothetical protein
MLAGSFGLLLPMVLSMSTSEVSTFTRISRIADVGEPLQATLSVNATVNSALQGGQPQDILGRERIADLRVGCLQLGTSLRSIGESKTIAARGF